MREVIVRHMGSDHRTRVPVIDWDAHRKTLLVHWGVAGVYEFSLSNGQGLDVAEWWVLDELTQIREHARKRGIPTGAPRPCVPPHKRGARKTRKLAVPPTDARQLEIADICSQGGA